MTTSRSPRVAALVAAVALIAGSCSGDRRDSRPTRPTPTVPPATIPSASPRPASSGAGDYLALGDSVPFGYQPSGNLRDATSFRGYPERAAAVLGFRVTNASCPGETTASFLTPRPRDLCRLWRMAGAMHVQYSGSQRDFAVGFLRQHPATRLVTVTLGANDLLLCDGRGPAACRSPAVAAEVLAAAGRRLRTILASLRAVYRGPLMLVTYYSTDYRNSGQTRALQLSSQGASRILRAVGGDVVDGFEAFRVAAASAGGDPCAAGLLAPLSSGGCDIHPSARGSEVLAKALVAKARSDQVR